MFMRSANDGGFNPTFIDKRAFSPSLSSIGAAGYQDPGDNGSLPIFNNEKNPYGSAYNVVVMGGNTAGSNWPIFSEEGNLRSTVKQPYRENV